MAVWLIRGGTEGQYELAALRLGLASIGWQAVGDISKVKDANELDGLLMKLYPGEKQKTIQAWRSQLLQFSQGAVIGDLVVMPMKSTREIAIGRITGNYEYRADLDPNMRHTRKVEWLVTDLPRSTFQQDLLNSLGSFRAVCQIKRNRAEERIKAVLAGAIDQPPEGETIELDVDLAEAAYDRIVRHISAEFPGAEMEKLVQGVLEAMGYHTMRKESGVKDKGVDILAAKGELGFGEPRICVQVKHMQDKVDQMTVQQLIGAMDDFRAERGLFVSWGGFKSTVLEMERNQFFRIRLWSQKTLVDKILLHFDDMPEDLRERLKLRRIWALEQDAEEAMESPE